MMNMGCPKCGSRNWQSDADEKTGTCNNCGKTFPHPNPKVQAEGEAMTDEAKQDQCPFCGAERRNLKTVLVYRCSTTKSPAEDGHWIRANGCYEREINCLRAERDTYKPYYDALRAQHNSYDEEFRRATHAAEPESPKAALEELLCEADELAEHKRLEAENAKLRAAHGQELARLLDVLSDRYEHSSADPVESIDCQDGRKRELKWLTCHYTTIWKRFGSPLIDEAG